MNGDPTEPLRDSAPEEVHPDLLREARRARGAVWVKAVAWLLASVAFCVAIFALLVYTFRLDDRLITARQERLEAQRQLQEARRAEAETQRQLRQTEELLREVQRESEQRDRRQQEAMRALAEQVRTLGGEPVVAVPPQGGEERPREGGGAADRQTGDRPGDREPEDEGEAGDKDGTMPPDNGDEETPRDSDESAPPRFTCLRALGVEACIDV